MKPYHSKDDLTIYHGDCADVTSALPDASINLIVEDWPYFRVKGEWWDRQWNKANEFLKWIDELCQERKRLLTLNGTLYAFASPQMCNDVRVVIQRHFNVINTVRWYKEDGWHKKAKAEDLRTYLEPWEAVIVAERYWTDETAADESGYYSQCKALHKDIYAPIGRYIQVERERAGLTRNEVEVALGYVSSDDPTRGTALCYRWEEGSSLPTQDAYERLRMLLNSHGNHGSEYLRKDYEDLRKDYEDLRKDYEDLRRPFHAEQCRYDSDLWHYAPVKDFPGKHPTEKPIAMIEDIIKVSSRPGDLVADFFLGRGTTADAARRCGRRFVGGDIMEKWVKASVARLSQAWMFTAVELKGGSSTEQKDFQDDVIR